MTGLAINAIIGSAIFGIPSELARSLGRASPLVMVLGALATSIILSCFVEVASQFREHGGVYLYARAAFGRFVGIQVGWFYILSASGGGAASANLFVIYLASSWPAAAHGWTRAALLTLLIGVLTAANYVGVKIGAQVSGGLAVVKLLPLALLIVLGVWRFGHHAHVIRTTEIAAPKWGAWASALLLVLFAYGGYEDSVVPVGEVKNPRRTVPFALFTGLLVAMASYALLQFVTVATIGVRATDHPLADVAIGLIGRGGAGLVAVAGMLSAYGNLSSLTLSVPRLPYSFAAHGDAPTFLAKLHARFKTPATAIVLFGSVLWLLALTGTYLWAVALSAGSMVVYYAVVCAALMRLRKTQPQADAFRVPFGSLIPVAGICITLVMLTRLERTEVLLMGVAALIATANWWWARRGNGVNVLVGADEEA
jgi:basic amino acid/polyamine antiporter, APA family